MKLRFWKGPALTFLAFGFLISASNEVRAQWAEVSTVRYGLFGRPRAVDTYLVPTSSYVVGSPVVATSYVVGSPVVATRYVQAYPTTYVSEVVPTTYVSTSYPVVSSGVVTTGYVTASPVVQTYVPAVPVVTPRVYIVP